MSYINLHPDINNGFAKGDSNFSGGTLQCHCRSDPVKVQITGNVAHNHACGCSKCWKPDGALFSIVGVVPVDNVKVVANANKLSIIDPNAAIQRNACKQCGVHLYGRIVKDHAFKGLDFIHVELSKEQGWQEPQFAAFVSSIIEQGFDAGKMDQVRSKLRSVGLEPYDCLNPGLMDALASYTAKSKLTSGQTQAVEEETNDQRPVESGGTPADVKGWGLLWKWLGITKTQKPKAKL